MRIDRLTLRHVGLALKEPFVTSWGAVRTRHSVVIEMLDQDGGTGFGEAVAFDQPWYTEETVCTAWHIIRDVVAPLIADADLADPEALSRQLAPIRGNPMAKAGVESAFWDLFAKRRGQTLTAALGGTDHPVPVGVAVGLNQPAEMVREIAQYLEQGYQRIKVKIKPGSDHAILSEIRRCFPAVGLVADANGAYAGRAISELIALDQYGLLMLEQPLAADDWMGHRDLHSAIATPICLDESITSYGNADLATTLGCCQFINVKWGRVGGLQEALRIRDLAVPRGVGLWCGGMLESGIGRAHSLALSSLEGFSGPGDVSAADRYWVSDIVHPAATVVNGCISIPDRPGIGYLIDREALNRATLDETVVTIR